MKNAILAIILTGTMCSMAHAGSALDALKKTAGPVSVEKAVNLTAGPVSVGKILTLIAPPKNRRIAADSVTFSLERSDIDSLIGIFDRVGVKGKSENGDCYSTEVIIDTRVRGFNPAEWSIIFNDDAATLTKEEIPSMIDMFNRLKVGSSLISGITRVSEVTIKSRVCNLRPAVWTATYYRKITPLY